MFMQNTFVIYHDIFHKQLLVLSGNVLSNYNTFKI